MLPFGLGNGRSGRRAQCVDGSFRGLNRFNCRSWRQRRGYHASRPSRLLPKAQCLQVLNVCPHGYPRVLTFLVADVICFVSTIVVKSFEQELVVVVDVVDGRAISFSGQANDGGLGLTDRFPNLSSEKSPAMSGWVRGNEWLHEMKREPGHLSRLFAAIQSCAWR